MPGTVAPPRLTASDPLRRQSLALVDRLFGAYLRHGGGLADLTAAVAEHVRDFGENPRSHGYGLRIDSCGEVCKYRLAGRQAPRGAGNFKAPYKARLAGRKGVWE